MSPEFPLAQARAGAQTHGENFDAAYALALGELVRRNAPRLTVPPKYTMAQKAISVDRGGAVQPPFMPADVVA